jgi:hypothetical protein
MICCSIYPADSIADLSAGGESLTAYIIKTNKFRLVIGGECILRLGKELKGKIDWESKTHRPNKLEKVSNDRGKMKCDWKAVKRKEN